MRLEPRGHRRALQTALSRSTLTTRSFSIASASPPCISDRVALLPSHPDRATVAGFGDVEFDKANPTPEADGARVCPVHADMHGADPSVGRHGKPGGKHAGP